TRRIDAGRDEARSRDTLDGRGIPGSVEAPSESAEGDSLRRERLRAADGDVVADGLKVGRDLPGQHLDEAGAEQPERGTRGGDALLGHEGPRLGHGGPRGKEGA